MYKIEKKLLSLLAIKARNVLINMKIRLLQSNKNFKMIVNTDLKKLIDNIYNNVHEMSNYKLDVKNVGYSFHENNPVLVSLGTVVHEPSELREYCGLKQKKVTCGGSNLIKKFLHGRVAHYSTVSCP